MAEHEPNIDPQAPRVDDLPRTGVPGAPPVPGAQWDELYKRWEHWDESTQSWVVVGDDPGEGVAPDDENPLPSTLARELLRADEAAAHRPIVPDVERAAEPAAAPKGAQWNEIRGRWERWDEAAGEWVEALADESDERGELADG